MNAERLLALYERVAEAPYAITRLRRFILDLAVRGKLVPQDPQDEPASELLKRIAKEKARLVKAGKFREPNSAIRIKREALGFSPPEHWGWASLIEIARPSYGFAFSSDRFNTAKRGMPLIRIRDISSTDTEAYFEGEYDPAYLVTAGDYLVGMDGDFKLRRWGGGSGLLNQRVMRINDWRCGINPEFVKLPLQSILDQLHGQTSLTTVKHLSAKQVNGIDIPLPPLAEQHRIVAKVDELMALCDQLEAARQERESRRDRLAVARLARLNAPDPETFQSDARFTLNALPALTSRPNQIKQLRQTILNLAVRGKLVPQDPQDEPASELLKRIIREKTRSIGRNKSLPEIQDSEKAFDMPAGWCWLRMGNVFSIRTGFAFKSSTYTETGTLIFRVTNFDRDGKFDLSNAVFFPTEKIDSKISGFSMKSGEIIMVMVGGTIGKTTVVDETILPALLNQNMWRIRSFGGILPSKFEYLLIKNINQSIQGLTQSTHGHFAMSDYEKRVFALPPLAEQHRIVAKVEELMALCERLEASLTTSDQTRTRLLEATLAEALAPASVSEMEPAE
jgi:type I restriction enzyme S subunit